MIPISCSLAVKISPLKTNYSWSWKVPGEMGYHSSNHRPFMYKILKIAPCKYKFQSQLRRPEGSMAATLLFLLGESPIDEEPSNCNHNLQSWIWLNINCQHEISGKMVVINKYYQFICWKINDKIVEKAIYILVLY